MPNNQPILTRKNKQTEERRQAELLEEEKQNTVKIFTEITQGGRMPWGHVPDEVRSEVERGKREVKSQKITSLCNGCRSVQIIRRVIKEFKDFIKAPEDVTIDSTSYSVRVSFNKSGKVVIVTRDDRYESLKISLREGYGAALCESFRGEQAYESYCVVTLPYSEKSFFNRWYDSLRKILSKQGDRLYVAKELNALELNTLMTLSFEERSTNSQPLHVDAPHHAALLSNYGGLNVESGAGSRIMSLMKDSSCSSQYSAKLTAAGVVGGIGLFVFALFMVKKAYRYVTSSVPRQLSDARLSSLDDSNQIQTSECGV